MRVLLLTHDSGHGGAQFQVLRAAQTLARRDRPVRCEVGLPGRGRLTADLSNLGVRCHDLPLHLGPHREERGLKAALKVAALPLEIGLLAAWLARRRPDVVHVHSALLQAPALAARAAGLPLVWSIFEILRDDTPHLAPRAGSRATARLVAHTADVVVSDSQACLDSLRDAAPTCQGRLLRSGLDPDDWLPDAAARRRWRDRLGLAAGDEVLLCLGLLAEKKGVLDLLAALARLAPGRPRLRLVLAGPGDAGPVREQVARRGLGDRVCLLPAQDDVRGLLATADLVVLPSHVESLSLALLEALAAGRPVVATLVGDTARYVTGASGGLGVPPREPAALADAIQTLLANRSRAQRLGRAGRRQICREHDLRTYADTLEDIYQAAARGGG